MCGIVGIINPKFTHSKVLKDLLYASGLRGLDSSGLMFKINDKDVNEVFVLKKVMQPADFMELESTASIIQGIYNLDFVIGHTRKTTVGTTNLNNAHPYVINNLVGMHNGTVKIKIEKNLDDPDTDSFALLSAIEKNENVVPVLENIDGSAALIWHKDNKLHLFRHNRPLSIAKSGTTTFIASEKRMLEYILYRNNIEGTIEEIREDVLIEIDYKNNKETETKINVNTPAQSKPVLSLPKIWKKNNNKFYGTIDWEIVYADPIAYYGKTGLGTPVVWYIKKPNPDNIGKPVKMVTWKEYEIQDKERQMYPSFFENKKFKLVCISTVE